MEQGYDRERFVDKVSEGLICSICKGVLHTPRYAPCEHCFCNACITPWLQTYGNNCPSCRTTLKIADMRDPPRFMKEEWKKLRLHCLNSCNGCQFVTVIELVAEHEKTCQVKGGPGVPICSLPKSAEPSTMTIFLINLNQITYTLEVKPTDSVDQVKQKILEKEGTPVAEQRLILGGKQLDKGEMADYPSFKDRCTIHLTLRVIGGFHQRKLICCW